MPWNQETTTFNQRFRYIPNELYSKNNYIYLIFTSLFFIYNEKIIPYSWKGTSVDAAGISSYGTAAK